jgi:Transglycosylase-like domain/Putative peptidoglycan binding domain
VVVSERIRPEAVEANDARAFRRRIVRAGISLAGAATVIGAVGPGVASADEPNHENLLFEGNQSGQAQNIDAVQNALQQKADGIFGPQTREQVVSFQREHGLLVDGIVGPQTRRAMFGQDSYSAGEQHSPSSSSAYYSSSDSSSSYSATSSSSGFSIPEYIVMCESRGNYRAVNSSTGAGGAYQIEPQTWRRFGGTGLPQYASKQMQDRVAKKIYQAQGSSPWQCA